MTARTKLLNVLQIFFGIVIQDRIFDYTGCLLNTLPKKTLITSKLLFIKLKIEVHSETKTLEFYMKKLYFQTIILFSIISDLSADMSRMMPASFPIVHL